MEGCGPPRKAVEFREPALGEAPESLYTVRMNALIVKVGRKLELRMIDIFVYIAVDLECIEAAPFIREDPRACLYDHVDDRKNRRSIGSLYYMGVDMPAALEYPEYLDLSIDLIFYAALFVVGFFLFSSAAKERLIDLHFTRKSWSLSIRFKKFFSEVSVPKIRGLSIYF
jgi:hypothetical protein